MRDREWAGDESLFFVDELRKALGRDAIDPRSPKECWEEAIEMVRRGKRYDDPPPGKMFDQQVRAAFGLERTTDD